VLGDPLFPKLSSFWFICLFDELVIKAFWSLILMDSKLSSRSLTKKDGIQVEFIGCINVRGERVRLHIYAPYILIVLLVLDRS